jgi:protein phosphatase
MAVVKYVWATATHVGHVRTNNEDSVTPEADGAGRGPVVIAVADGMGGAVGGEIASRIAIDAAVAEPGTPGARVTAANAAVLAEVADQPALYGMGTTLTLGIFDPAGLVELAHVGDSRAYLYRVGVLEQITYDHTVVMEMVRSGMITEAQAATHPRRHMLSRVIGMADVTIDELSLPLHDGDRLLFCSDGLSNYVADSAVSMVLRTAPSPSDAAWSLVEAANRSGGHDNTTVAVVDVLAD